MTLRAPLIQPPEAQLRQLMHALEIDFVRLTECVVSPGWRLSFGGSDVASVHYNLAGNGRVTVVQDEDAARSRIQDVDKQRRRRNPPYLRIS
jgi:hypothetical protein